MLTLFIILMILNKLLGRKNSAKQKIILKALNLNIYKKETNPIKGLILIEKITIGYILFTLVFTLCFVTKLPNLTEIIGLRLIVFCSILLAWKIYLMYPNRLMHLIRVVLPIAFLAKWYPDLYELNRIFTNYDYIFAPIEEAVFGFQPAILFSQFVDKPWFSEIMYLAYISYFPLILIVLMYYFFMEYKNFDKAASIIMGGFVMYYLIYVFLPVAGPQYYFKAIGLNNANNAIFPNIGHFFENNTDVLHNPGWDKGVFYKLFLMVHKIGERPMASFPSSHVGITTIVFLLGLRTKKLWLIVPIGVFYILLCLSTVYTMAHYAIDSIAGAISGLIFYIILLQFIQLKHIQHKK